MLLLTEGLPRDQFQIDFICLHDPGIYADRATAAGARVTALGFRGPSEWSGGRVSLVVSLVWNVARFVRLTAFRYDVIDAWLFNAYALAAITRVLTWPRSMIAGRRSLSGYKSAFNPAQRLGERLSIAAADAVVANSEAVAVDVLRLEPVDPRRLHVIHNATLPAIPMSADARRRQRAAWGADDQSVVIGCVANYKPAKGLELLIDAMAELGDREPSLDLRLVLVGEGRLRPELDRRRARLGLGDRVVLHGRSREARELCPAFDLFAFASEAEGFPNVLLEAAAAGLPIVATAAGGSAEIVIDGVTGRLVAIGDRPALVDALQALVRDVEARGRLGEAARSHVLTEFGAPAMVAAFARLYRQEAGRGRSGWRHRLGPKAT